MNTETDNHTEHYTKSDAEFVSGGVPVKPDVDRLIEAFGIPEIGKTISYSEVADVILVPHGSYRFNTVVHAWRKQLLREHNCELLVERGAWVYFWRR